MFNNFEELVSNVANRIKQKKVLVTDLDEVLVDSTALWKGVILRRSGHLTLVPPAVTNEEFISTVRNRKIFDLTGHLNKELGFDFSESYVMGLYMNHEDFYEHLDVTEKMGASVSLVCNRQKELNFEVHILSHYPDIEGNEHILKSKERFVKRFFKDAVLHQIPKSVSKAQYISDNISEYTTFIDDRMDIMRDVLANTDSYGKEFLMPKLGYNVPDDDLKALISEKDAMFYLYNPGHHPSSNEGENDDTQNRA